jgi:NAD(P)-dependent dehydrogenase (short-subunit alcohol dehydrogenase family)
MDFSSKLVVITGIGRAGQLGEAVALSFAQQGATLAVVDRLEEEAQARAADLVSAGFAASAYAADLTSEQASTDLVERIASAHAHFRGHVHAVICAAGGYAGGGPLDQVSSDEWHRMYAINLETAFQTTRAFLPALRLAKGSLVYFTSVASLPGGTPKGMAAYAAAKSGVISLMRSVAADERDNGVRANAIAPTAIRTAANIESMGADKKYVDRESVADVASFLASDLARNVSGQVLTLA